jgi:hypothetical protein
MLADHEALHLFLEIRDETAHQVSFSAYALEARKLLWQNQRFEEDWWIGMTAADQDALILHTFEDTENPEKKAFFAVRSSSGEVMWKSGRLQVMDVYQQHIYGFEREEDETLYKGISIETNQEKSLSLDEVAQALKEVSGENKYIRHPFHYTEEEAYFKTVSQFIQQYLNQSPLRACEYLEHHKSIFISYYIEEGKALANYLLVVDEEGELQLHEKLDDQLSQPGLGTFMIIRDQLVFIKRKRELLSYAI